MGQGSQGTRWVGKAFGASGTLLPRAANSIGSSMAGQRPIRQDPIAADVQCRGGDYSHMTGAAVNECPAEYIINNPVPGQGKGRHHG